MHAKSLQSCLTLCNFMDCSPPGSSVLGILQARTLKLVAISFSRGLNSCLLHCRQILYCLSHQGSPLVTVPLLNYVFALTLQSTWNIILKVFRCYTVFSKKYFIDLWKYFGKILGYIYILAHHIMEIWGSII